MSPERFLVVTDTPGIKHFVFGTDALADVRGASALLDRLNQRDTERLLRQGLLSSQVEVVFANGGTGQFLVEATSKEEVENALNTLACHYRDNTGGEMHIVWGVVPYPQGATYKDTARHAHFQMRLVRETASANHSAALMPLLMECSSASHLPARTERFPWGGEKLQLSEAVVLKRNESRASGSWADWMKHLAQPQLGDWPDPKSWPDLRAREAELLVDAQRRDRARARKGYVGLIYADGNSMGRLVQELDSPETCSAFSQIVDQSIHEACYAALDSVCASEIAAQRAAPTRPRYLPADILLLGGDDLVVLLPADVALNFTLHTTQLFEEITRRRIADHPAKDVRTFFQQQLGPKKGMTISCGVALAPAKYPFYLLRDLAEDLLKRAKKAGTDDEEAKEARKQRRSWAPSYIDFHLVVGAAGADLEVVREDDYLVGVKDATEENYVAQRTLRPYRREKLERLRGAVTRLHQARLPRSKLQDLFDAALHPRQPLAELHAQELFGRLREDRVHHERQALWSALTDLGMKNDFPWCVHKKRTAPALADLMATALADLVEAYDLFPREETP